MSNKPFEVKHGLEINEGTFKHKGVEIIDIDGRLDYGRIKNQALTRSPTVISDVGVAGTSDYTQIFYKKSQLYTKTDTYTKTEVNQLISDLKGTAPAALDSFKELADAINSDATYYQTVNNLLLNKVATSTLTSSYYTKTEVNQLISDLIGSAPASMDTLSEIADALGDDPSYADNLNIQTMQTLAAVIDLQDKWISEHP
jgi:hypothetical protein